MNASPSKFPRLEDGISVPEPGFDILLAVSNARQASLPTVQLLKVQAMHTARRERTRALTHILCGRADRAATGRGANDLARLVRFLELPDEEKRIPETMNGLFTRGFQAMLSPFGLPTTTSVTPIPPDVETME